MRRKNSVASFNRGVTTIAIDLNCKCSTVEASINENVLTIQKLMISCTPATRENKPQDLTQSAKNQINILEHEKRNYTIVFLIINKKPRNPEGHWLTVRNSVDHESDALSFSTYV